MSHRIEYLDFLKMFAIFTVLLGHSTEQISADLFWDHPIWSFLYSFHMPLFMFVCGFFFKSSLNKPFGKMAAGKLRQLGIPSLTAYAICVIIMLLTGTRAIFDLCDLSLAGFMNSVWFLKCVLLCYLIMYPVCRLVRSDIAAAAAASVLILFVPGMETVNLNFMLPMFCLGMVCGSHIGWVEKHRTLLTCIAIPAFAVLLLFWSGRMTVYMVPTRILSFQPAAIDYSNLGLTVYRLAIGMAGSLTFFLLAKPVWSWLSQFSWSPVLCRIGSATLGIYFLQTFLLEIFIHSLHLFIPIPWSCVAAPLIALAELVILYNLVLLIRRTRVLRLLVLGEQS